MRPFAIRRESFCYVGSKLNEPVIALFLDCKANFSRIAGAPNRTDRLVRVALTAAGAISSGKQLADGVTCDRRRDERE